MTPFVVFAWCRPLLRHHFSLTCCIVDESKARIVESRYVVSNRISFLSFSLLGSTLANIPIANAKPEDVSDLLGGALFLPLFKWMNEYGPIYRLAAGPRNFVIVSDPAIAKHVLRNYGTKYAKGLVAEVSEFLFGSGFAIAEGSLWTARRRAVVPSLHKKYLSVIVDRVFCKCSERFVEKLKSYALNDTDVNMEEQFSQLTLDVIGLAVFNYYLDSPTADSPVIESVYTTLKEAEARSTDLLPYWKGAYNGARQLEVTINGIGERAGNASLEEGELLGGFYTGINTRHIVMASKMVEEYSGLMLQPHKAIVGANAFAHESGIHQVYKHFLKYQDLPKESGPTHLDLLNKYEYKLEDVVSVDDAIEITKTMKNMSMIDFEATLYAKYGRTYCELSNCAMNLDWDSGKTYLYDCYVSADGNYQFKGPHLNTRKTHVQRVLGDDNVLIVQFTDDPNTSDMSSNYSSWSAAYQIISGGISIGLPFKDGRGDKNNLKSSQCALALSNTVNLQVDLSCDKNEFLVYDKDGEALIHTDGIGRLLKFLIKLGTMDMFGEIGVLFNIPQPFTVRSKRVS
ncbi:hypothetical protein L1887_22749 [Cichorium endivia]|nr:hypothetical protein L1887_22749 [Cichorium endivia]